MIKTIRKCLPKTLIGRLVLLPSTAIMTFFVVAAVFIGYFQYHSLYNNLIKNSTVLTKEIGTSIEKYLLLDDFAEAESIMHRFNRLETINSIALINDSGIKIVEVQHKNGAVTPTIYETTPSYRFLSQHQHLIINENAHSFIIYSPLYKGESRWWIKIEITKNGLYTQLVHQFAFVAFIVLCFMVLMSFIIIKVLRNPLDEVKKLTDFSSDLDAQIGSKITIDSSVEEIDALSKSLNHLSEKLLDNQRTMNKQNQELLAFNRELMERVEEETRKNREKDAILFKQSRIVALGEMMEHIAHQWRQPLNAVAITLQDLELASALDELTAEHVSVSVTEAMGQILYLSQTIDEFSRYVNANREEAPFNFADVIHQTVSLISSSLAENKISMDFEMNELLISPKGSAQGFGEVILSILNNAKDAFSHNHDNLTKQIHISLQQNSLEISIEIVDNAGGIPDEIIEKIFDPYVTTKHQYKGTGLGLYICKSIIEQDMNGYLSVKNDNNGARFLITFPNG
ncbi:MAG: HAMP domain-containing sensor histidine kinase [Sulfurimonas sp.]|jgi:signal transduction histidine kinase